MKLLVDKIIEYMRVLEEGQKSFAQLSRDPIAQAQAEIFFSLGIRNPDLMKFGIKQAERIKKQYQEKCLDVIRNFQRGRLDSEKAYRLWRSATKEALEKMYRAGGAIVGNPFYKDLPFPVRDKRLMVRYLNREGQFWKKFLRDIKSPTHRPVFPYEQRALFYADSLEAMKYNGMLFGSGEEVEIHWVLGVPMTDHCSDCEVLAQTIWTPKTLPTVPRAGDTACLYRCYCHLEIKPIRRALRITSPGRGSVEGLTAVGRYARVLDSSGQEVGGALQANIEALYARMNKARQMTFATKGAERRRWILIRKRLNQMIVDATERGRLRAVPSIEVSKLEKTIRSVMQRTTDLVDDFSTLQAGDEVFLVRSDFSSYGIIDIVDGRYVFKSPSGLVIDISEETDIIFRALGDPDKVAVKKFMELIGKGSSPPEALSKIFDNDLQKDLWNELMQGWTATYDLGGLRKVVKKAVEEEFGIESILLKGKQEDFVLRAIETYLPAYLAEGKFTEKQLFGKIKKIIKRVRACTHEYLKRKYPKGYVTLYRGVSPDELRILKKGTKEIVRIDVDSVTGFTSNERVAQRFAGRYEGVVIKVKVPIENVVITPDFEFSSFPEEVEWLILGKDDITKFLEVEGIGKPASQLSEPIKWGLTDKDLKSLEIVDKELEKLLMKYKIGEE